MKPRGSCDFMIYHRMCDIDRNIVEQSVILDIVIQETVVVEEKKRNNAKLVMTCARNIYS